MCYGCLLQLSLQVPIKTFWVHVLNKWVNYVFPPSITIVYTRNNLLGKSFAKPILLCLNLHCRDIRWDTYMYVFANVVKVTHRSFYVIMKWDKIVQSTLCRWELAAKIGSHAKIFWLYIIEFFIKLLCQFLLTILDSALQCTHKLYSSFLWTYLWLAADFISHSMSREQLKFIFCDLLPDLSGKTVLDIGSRMGPVLYAVSSRACCLVTLEY